MSLWGQIAINVGGVVAICGMGYILGFSKNRKIEISDLASELETREPRLTIQKHWLSDNKTAALMQTTDGRLFLLKTVGDELSLREVLAHHLSLKNNEIVVDMQDIGFPRVVSKFAENDIAELSSSYKVGAAA
jgi:hypothetical protein